MKTEEVKPENLELGEEEETTDEGIVEFTTREELIGCSYNCIMAVSDMDTGMMSKVDAMRVKRIIRRSLRILDEMSKEMYDELFDDRNEEEED